MTKKYTRMTENMQRERKTVPNSIAILIVVCRIRSPVDDKFHMHSLSVRRTVRSEWSLV